MTSLFVYILRGTSPFFSSVSCHLPFGNHAKTNIFPHNILITFAADVQRSVLHIAFQARRSLSCFRYHVLSLNYPKKVRIFLEIIILTDESLKSTELFPHVHWLHAQEVVKVSMQLTDHCHGLHFYADVLFQLAGTDVSGEY